MLIKKAFLQKVANCSAQTPKNVGKSSSPAPLPVRSSFIGRVPSHTSPHRKSTKVNLSPLNLCGLLHSLSHSQGTGRQVCQERPSRGRKPCTPPS